MSTDSIFNIRIPIVLELGGVEIPHSHANLMLWRLYNHPRRALPIAEWMGLSGNAAMKRLHRAAEALGRVSPRLAVELRHHIHWQRGIATYTPSRVR
ncbi:hypothetical protein [Paraburkholderia diazotrophica]|uniref:Uncharacterized protein n=1 Tax=Paraburkholderia diazotrophica TaxID=667676 RepID=A0A1H6UVG4_9BURK|nr:hypothetical protein [Paraburkholderia diazotrophica]SEI96413.1 hypothetical protein SAMN05192539_1005217 [Paraburkholderia diazotrophica]